MPKTSPSPNAPSALLNADPRAADAQTREGHERIWQEFLKRPAVFVYEPRILHIPGVVGMLTLQALITDRSIRRRLRRVFKTLEDLSCVKAFSDDYLHMTIVPPALLTTGQPRPPLLLPDGWEKQALKPMRESLRGYGPFEVRIQGLNVFRDVLVAVAYDGGHSAAIRQRLAEALPELPEKYWGVLPALPHISVAQFCNTDGVAELRDAVSQLRDVDLGTLRVTRVYLARAELQEGVFGGVTRYAISLTG